jgi:2-dehydro-3-deoxy-L-rhamnonate dehydrogenase (NAD+)
MTMDPAFDFSGQTAIVTGGARGIGRAIATQFVQSGAAVWIWDTHPVELNGTQSLSVDVTKPDQIKRALAPLVSQSTRIDILVNNAGYLGSYLPFDELDASECQQIVQVNLISISTLSDYPSTLT